MIGLIPRWSSGTWVTVALLIVVIILLVSMKESVALWRLERSVNELKKVQPRLEWLSAKLFLMLRGSGFSGAFYAIIGAIFGVAMSLTPDWIEHGSRSSFSTSVLARGAISAGIAIGFLILVFGIIQPRAERAWARIRRKHVPEEFEQSAEAVRQMLNEFTSFMASKYRQGGAQNDPTKNG
jgi:hypothetical protein